MTTLPRTVQPKLAALTFCLCTLLAAVVLRPTDGCAADSRYVRQTPGAARVIVFVHGVLGNGTSAWTAPNKAYWPEMLTKDSTFNDFDIYVYEYPTTMVGSTFSIDEIADSMRLFFDEDRVSAHSELIFVAHSMGGLALRAYLTKYRNVAPKTRLIYFYSTPTTGSEIASLASLISTNPQLAEMRPMQSADYLAALQRQWLAADLGIASYCAYEKRPTYRNNIVTQASASNLCNKRLDPIDEDHMTIVKPTDMRHPSYLTLKSALSQTPPLRASEEKSGGEPGVSVRIASDASFWTNAGADIGHHVGTAANDERPTLRYARRFLVLRVLSSYKKAAFNAPEYATSLKLSSVEPRERELRLRTRPLRTRTTTKPETALTQEDFIIYGDDLEKLQAVRLQSGQRGATVSAANLTWRDVRVDYYSSDASIALLVVEAQYDDPDNVVLRDVRVLKSPTQDRSLIEILLENFSNRAISASTIYLSAFAFVYQICSPPRPDYNPWRPVKLKVNRSRSAAANESTAQSGNMALVGTSELGGEPIVVEGQVSADTCGGFNLAAQVPVDDVIGPLGTTRIRLALEVPYSEILPDRDRYLDHCRANTRTKSLDGFFDLLRLKIEGSPLIYPNSFDLRLRPRC